MYFVQVQPSSFLSIQTNIPKEGYKIHKNIISMALMYVLYQFMFCIHHQALIYLFLKEEVGCFQYPRLVISEKEQNRL